MHINLIRHIGWPMRCHRLAWQVGVLPCQRSWVLEYKVGQEVKLRMALKLIRVTDWNGTLGSYGRNCHQMHGAPRVMACGTSDGKGLGAAPSHGSPGHADTGALPPGNVRVSRRGQPGC